MKKWYVTRSNITDYAVEFVSPVDAYNNQCNCAYFGPFRTFSKAKEEALRLIREDVSELQLMVSNIKDIKRSDFPKQ